MFSTYIFLFWQILRLVSNWPIYFFNRYGFITKGHVQYKLRNGITIFSRPFAIDGSALNDVWLDETYDPNKVGISFDWSACKHILDIGANIGTFTVYAGHKAHHAHIVSVEPEPGNREIFRKNVEANRLHSRVTLVEKGIGKEEGEATFFLSTHNSGGHSLFRHKESGNAVSVPITTLQKVFDEHRIAHCDFLKLDCEGGEYEGLYGLRDDTLKSIKFMAIEVHNFSKDPTHTPQHLQAFLKNKGFRIVEARKSVFFAIPSAL